MPLERPTAVAQKLPMSPQCLAPRPLSAPASQAMTQTTRERLRVRGTMHPRPISAHLTTAPLMLNCSAAPSPAAAANTLLHAAVSHPFVWNSLIEMVVHKCSDSQLLSVCMSAFLFSSCKRSRSNCHPRYSVWKLNPALACRRLSGASKLLGLRTGQNTGRQSWFF